MSIQDAVPDKVYAPRLTILETTLKVCSYCLQPPAANAKLQLCSLCKRAAYCNATCQKRDWKLIHKNKNACPALQNLNEMEKQRWSEEPNVSREKRIELQPLHTFLAQNMHISSPYVLQGIMHCATCLRTPFQQSNLTTYSCCPRCQLAWWCSEECKLTFDKAHTSIDCDALQTLSCVDRFNIDYHISRRRFVRLMVTSPPRTRYLSMSSLSGWSDYYEKIFKEHDRQMIRASAEFHNIVNAKRAATLLSQDTLTIPLTIAEGLARAFPDIAKRAKIRIHILGADEREALATGITEELLHLLPALRSLDIRYIGPNATPDDAFGQPMIYKDGNVACAQCSPNGRSRTLKESTSPYHECAWSRPGNPSQPDFIVAFNSGMSEVAHEGWLKSLRAVLDLDVPALFTAYTLMEATAEETLVRKLGAKVICGVTENKWASGVPIVNTYWADEDRMGDDGPHTTARNNRWLLMIKGREMEGTV